MPEEQRERAVLGYRLYNRPEVLAALIEAGVFELRDLQAKIHGHKAVREVFKQIEDRGEPVLSAAYKINVAGGLKNLDSISKMVHAGSRASKEKTFELRPHSAMYTCHGIRGATGAGAFICYQTMQDLIWIQPEGFRYRDDDEWAYPSTGAARGLARLFGYYDAASSDRDIKWARDPSSPIWRMLERLTVMRKTADMSPLPEMARTAMSALMASALDAGHKGFNMFEVEHNLCEVDKYLRIQTGEGKGSTFLPRGEGSGDTQGDEGATKPRRRASAGRGSRTALETASPAVPLAPVEELDPDSDEFTA